MSESAIDWLITLVFAGGITVFIVWGVRSELRKERRFKRAMSQVAERMGFEYGRSPGSPRITPQKLHRYFDILPASDRSPLIGQMFSKDCGDYEAMLFEFSVAHLFRGIRRQRESGVESSNVRWVPHTMAVFRIKNGPDLPPFSIVGKGRLGYEFEGPEWIESLVSAKSGKSSIRVQATDDMLLYYQFNPTKPGQYYAKEVFLPPRARPGFFRAAERVFLDVLEHST